MRAHLNGTSANVILHFDPIITSEDDSMGDFGTGNHAWSRGTVNLPNLLTNQYR